MKSIRNLALLFAALVIGLGVNAQAAQSTTPASATPASKQGTAPSKSVVQKADPVDPKMKGPKGETVYTGPKGGKYYMDASGNKKYLKQDSTTPKTK